jgi:hypothetical protein
VVASDSSRQHLLVFQLSQASGAGTLSPTVMRVAVLRPRVENSRFGSSLELFQQPGPTVSLLWLFTAFYLSSAFHTFSCLPYTFTVPYCACHLHSLSFLFWPLLELCSCPLIAAAAATLQPPPPSSLRGPSSACSTNNKNQN